MKERNSNIELLRLLCIVMIISMHVFGLYDDNLNTAGLAALSFNNAVCNMSVSIFMLISGYYGIRYKTDKLLSLWNIALFWSLALIFVDADHTAKNFVRSIFPVFTGKYWFLTSYIVIYCLSSYIEKLVQSISKCQFQMLLGVLLLFFVVAPSFLMLEILRDSGKGVMNMLTVYLIGRYFAIYGLPKRLSGLTGGGILLIVILIIASVDLTITLHFNSPFQMLARDNCILVLLGAITVFTMVMLMKPRIVGWVNKLASYVFPIYVMHGALMSRLAYIPGTMTQVLYMIVWLNAIGISMIAIVMEVIRRLLLNKQFNWILHKEMEIVEKAQSYVSSRLK